MKTENMVFYTISFTCFLIAINQGYSLISMRGKVKTVTGTIVDIKSAAPEAYRQCNSKFATFLYFVNGERYISENRVPVPMSAQIGDTRLVKVIIDTPQRLYGKTNVSFIVPLIAAVLCALLGLFVDYL